MVAKKQIAEDHLQLADDLVFNKEPPKKLNESPGYFKCRFCDHKPVCHLNTEPDYNCRTCAFAKPIPNAEWLCEFTGEIISKETQLVGCNTYSRLM